MKKVALSEYWTDEMVKTYVAYQLAAGIPFEKINPLFIEAFEQIEFGEALAQTKLEDDDAYDRRMHQEHEMFKG